METLNRALIALLLLYVGIKETRGEDIETCVVSDFEQSEILYSYKNTEVGPMNNIEAEEPQIRMGDENGNFHSPMYAVYENTAGNAGVLNYNMECWNQLNMCRAKVNMLKQAENRQHLFGLSSVRAGSSSERGVRLQIKDASQSNWIDCIAVGRTLDFAEDDQNDRVLYQLENDGWSLTYGRLSQAHVDPATLGLSGFLPDNFIIHTTGSASSPTFEGIEVRTSSNSVIQSFGDVTGNQETILEIESDIVSITVRYAGDVIDGTDTVTGEVCGLVIKYASSSDDVIGCNEASSDDMQFDIGSGEKFAGFIGFQQEAVPDEFLIQPLVYTTVDSMIYYYGRTHDSVTIHVNTFTSGSGITYTYSSWNGIDTTDRDDGEYVSTTSVPGTLGDDGENEVTIDVSCGCIQVTFTIAGEDPFYAWSFGFDPISSRKTSGTIIGEDVDTFFPAASLQYEVNSDQNYCPDMRPMMYYPTAIGGVLYLDGFLGIASSSSITNVVDEAQFVDISSVYNQVEVYITNNVVVGLKLSWSGTSAGMASIGDTSGIREDTLSDGDNKILTRLEIIDPTSVGSTAQIVRVYLSEPTPPCLFSGQTVLDIDGTGTDGAWIQGGSNAIVNRDDDADADQYQYWFHLPVSYTTIHVDLSGYFLSQECEDGCDPETYKLTLDSTNFRKGTIATGKFYHLQAEHEYFFRAKGEVDDYSSTTGADLESEYNTLDDTNFPAEVAARTFTTPDGVRYYCDAQGDTDVQVEYEALPDVEIKLAETPKYSGLASLTGSSGFVFTAVSTFASSSQEVQFPNTEFFHFPAFGADNKHCYPKFPEFTGYPIGVLAYWSNSEQCIKGLGLTYKDRNGNTEHTYWLAGSQAGYTSADNSANGNVASIDLKDKIIDDIWGSTGEIGSTGINCLRTIRFQYVGSSDNSGCIGPGSTGTGACGSEMFVPDGFSREKTNFFFYAFSGSYTNQGDGNDYIVALSAHYAYVDLPELRSGTGTCELTRTIDWNYIRNTVWYREVDLDTDTSNCVNAQYVYALGKDEVTAIPDQWDPDRHINPNGDHEVVYHQALTRQRDHGDGTLVINGEDIGGLSITRQNDWEINLFCYYNATKNVHSNFSVEAEPEWHADGTNEFKFSLRMYKECNYENEYDDGATPIMLVNEPVYMAVTLDETGSVTDSQEYQVVGFACWASDDVATVQDPADYYLLAGSDGCYADSTFRWNESATTSKKEAMYFDAFAFFQNSATVYTPVYVTCRVRACLSEELAANQDCYRDDWNKQCSDTATTNNNDRADYDPIFAAKQLATRRSRRNAKGQEIEKIQTISSRTAFIVKKRDVENAVHIERGNTVHTLDQGGVRMAAGMFSLFVTTMFFCLMVISYKVYRLRNNYKKLKEEAQ